MVSKNIRLSGEKTRERILKAARELFIKQGFSATSFTQIAEKAKINRSLIIHHFINKELLWKVIKASFLNSIPAFEISPEIQSLAEFIQQFISQRFYLYDKNPAIIRVMAWQRLEKNSQGLEGGTKLSPDHFLNTIKTLQKRKEIRKDWDAELILLWLAASISGAFLSKENVFSSEQQRGAYISMLIEGFCKTLSPIESINKFV